MARVAVVTTSWPRFDGDPAGHFVAADVRAMAQRGDVDIEVIAARGDAFGWPGLAARVREKPWRALGVASWVMEARNRVTSGGFDRVVAHWAVPCAWPIASSSDARFALDVVSHGGDVRLLARLPPSVRAHVVRRVADRAQSWRFVAVHLLDTVVSRVPAGVGRAVERVACIGASAIDLTAPGERAIEEKKKRIAEPFAVCVGRLVASKRVDEAIAWAAREEVTLVVVGDGPERASLERAARAQGGPTRVVFVGDVDRPEALAWIAASELVVSASQAEGLSTVQREADALGVPFVSASTSTVSPQSGS